MADRRSARSRKVVDYARISGNGMDDEDDDDFVDSTPPPTKKTKKEAAPRTKKSINRPTPDDIQFEKEMSLVMKISQQDNIKNNTPQVAMEGEVDCQVEEVENPSVRTAVTELPKKAPAQKPQPILDDDCIEVLEEDVKEVTVGRHKRRVSQRSVTKHSSDLTSDEDDGGSDFDVDEESDGDDDDEFDPDSDADSDFDSKRKPKSKPQPKQAAKKSAKPATKAKTPNTKVKPGSAAGTTTQREANSLKRSTVNTAEVNLPGSNDESVTEIRVAPGKVTPSRPAIGKVTPGRPTASKATPSRPTTGKASSTVTPPIKPRPFNSPVTPGGSIKSSLGGVNVSSPNSGLRLGLSRNRRGSPLHPNVKLPT